MRAWFLALILLSGTGVPRLCSREAFLRTWHGRIIQGQVRWETNAIVLADAAQELLVRVPLDEVAEMVFLRTADDEFQRSAPSRDRWQDIDIGSVSRTGRSEKIAGTAGFRVWGAGTNILADQDAFHFVFRQVRGASELVAKVSPTASPEPSARAGLMMREGLAANARNIMLSISAGRGEVLQWRDKKGGDTTALIDAGGSTPHWLKLKRLGRRISAYRSRDGRWWQPVDRVEFDGLATELCVGFAVVSVRDSALYQAAFERVEEGPWLSSRWFPPEIELCSTSVARGPIASMDDALIYFEGTAARVPLARAAAAIFRFRPLSPWVRHLVNSGRRGVLLASGEFVDGECRAIADGAVTLSSVPLGLRQFALGTEVAALVLGERGKVPEAPWEVATNEGSVWRAAQVELEPNNLRLREPALGWRSLPFHMVAEVRHRRLPAD